MHAWHGHRCATPRRRSRSGRRARGSGRRPTPSSVASGPDHAPRFDVEVTIGSLAPQRGEGRHAARRRAGSRRPPCSSARACGRPVANGADDGDPLRLRRDHRRAQCRQVDAGQPAGRHQGLDRQPQGADDAVARPRHRHGRASRRSSSSTRPASSRPKRRLDRAMVETAWGGARDADLVALLIDASNGHRAGGPRPSRQARGRRATRRSSSSTRSTW